MTSDEPLDARYFYWLYKLVGSLSSRNPARSHWQLAEQLYRKPFSWIIPNDDERAADGLDLKLEFLSSEGLALDDLTRGDQTWLTDGCSFFEMLVALSRRVSYESTGEIGDWFWKLMDNLDLKRYTDEVYSDDSRYVVDQILDIVINREYQPNGDGGLFPLQHADQDQRNLEIWYQMHGYILETIHFE